MNGNIDLTGLKGLHYPNSPSWWPLSYGWYILLGALLLFMLVLVYKRRCSSLAYTKREIKKIEQLPIEKQLKSLSQLLKRVAMRCYGREKIAPLSEEAWQEFLLAAAPGVLTKDQAHLLAYAIYNPTPAIPHKKLFTDCHKWIEKVLKNRKPIR